MDISNGHAGGDIELRHRMGTPISTLDGWPCCSLNELNVKVVTLSELHFHLQEPPRGGVIAAQISGDFSADVRFRTGLTSFPGERGRTLSLLERIRSFSYFPQWLILIDEPCRVFSRGGAVVLPNGKILSESIYPTANERTLERQLGEPGLKPETLNDLLSASTSWNESTVAAPLCSRWSSVYSHAIAETLVHDAIIRRVGVSGFVSYVVPKQPYGCERLALTVSKEGGVPQVACPTPIANVPRVLLSSLLYSFGIYGSDWQAFTAETRKKCQGLAAKADPPIKRVYVSRFGSSVRPMRNEAELIRLLVDRGFHIFEEKNLSFLEQVATFTSASLVVGPHGSGLLNAGFAPPGASLVELRPLNRPPTENPMVDNFVLRIAAGSNLQYFPHISENSISSDEWYVNLKEALDIVDSLCSS